MLHRLCGPPSIHLSFNLAAVLPRRSTYRVCWETQLLRLRFCQISSWHRWWRGLPGYLILFAPHAFAAQCQYWPRRPLSPPVFFQISTHFTATLGILSPSAILKLPSFGSSSHVKHGDFTADLSRHLPALYAQSFRLTLEPPVLPRLLARSLPVLIHYVTSQLRIIGPAPLLYNKSALQPEGLVHTRGMAASEFPPLCNIPYCCLP